MPTYEYRCPQGHAFEKFFPTISDKLTAACPTCGKRAKRLISGGAGLVFKGSGFYITDYQRAGRPPERDGSSTDAKPAEGDTAKGKKKKEPPAGDK
jgi:putative FmdB family regulatory protein